LWDPSLSLTPAERQQYVGQAIDQLRTNDAERQAQLKVAQVQAADLTKMLDTDARLADDSSVDRTIRNLSMLGDPNGAMDLIKKRAGARFLTSGSFGTADDTGQVAL
jgi:hypothetical protein